MADFSGSISTNVRAADEVAAAIEGASPPRPPPPLDNMVRSGRLRMAEAVTPRRAGRRARRLCPRLSPAADGKREDRMSASSGATARASLFTMMLRARSNKKI